MNKLPRYMDPRPCRPSKNPSEVAEMIKKESELKGLDPKDHPGNNWWHCEVCRVWHPKSLLPVG